MTALRRAGAALTGFLGRLIVEPVRRGRLRDHAWPQGLRPVVAVGVGAFWLAVALIVAAPLVRDLSPLTVSVGSTVLSLPRTLLPTILWLVLLAAVLAQTAALHARLVVAIVITSTVSLVVLFLGGLDLGADAGAITVTPGKVVSVVVVLALVALLVARRRRAFAWWEFPVVLTLIGAAAVTAIGRSSSASAAFGLDFAPVATSLVISSIGQLAVPAAIAAGVAVAELAVVATVAAVAALRRASTPSTQVAVEAGVADAPPGPPRTRRLLVAALLVVGAWRCLELALAPVVGEPLDADAVGPSIVLLGALGLLWWALAAVRRSATVSVDDVLDHLDGIALPVAVALSVTLAPVVLALLSVQIAAAWGAPPEPSALALAAAETLRGTVALTAVRLAVGAALVGAAVVLARRGRRGAPELVGAIGVVTLVSTAPRALGLDFGWSSDALAALLALGSLALTGVLLLRGQLDERRLALLVSALLLSAAAAWRDVIADPLGVLLGASGLALVLLGFVWGFLTDAEGTHGDSARYPRPTRVLLFLANAVFGVAVLAFGALARDVSAGIDLDAFARSGDELLGTALIVAAAMAVWAGALPSRRPRARPLGRLSAAGPSVEP